ncbi:MAG: ion transporter [Candidatus Marinimicrobia bacterium]|nr:ion transporter [Candidatus Neomarinimicrobiota bacterium]
MKVIIFGTDTPAGKYFDLVLIISILLSVLIVMLDSVSDLHKEYGLIFNYFEWIFTILFSLEYLLRIYCIRIASSYIFSLYGIIDLLALIPTYLAIFLPGASVFSVIRVLRVLRVFRILKLVQFMGEANLLIKAIKSSRRKILVFLFFVINLVIILGSIMYLVEGESSGFDSIPRSIYWAIVTLTTVGYGDISPITNLGQFIAASIMIMGYVIIAIPTGIVATEMRFSKRRRKKVCIVCNDDKQELNAKFCSNCGAKFETI